MTPDQLAAENVRKLKAAADRAELHRKSLSDLGWATSPDLLWHEGLPYFVVTVPPKIDKKIPQGQVQTRTFYPDGAMKVQKL